MRHVCAIGLALVLSLGVARAEEPGTIDDLGSLLWLERTGGALDRKEAFRFVTRALGPLVRAVWRRTHPGPIEKVDLAKLAPPDTPMVKAAVKLLEEKASPPFRNHAYRTAYWALVVMKRERPELTPQEIEEAWVAALLHDLGLEDPPTHGEFTLGGVAAVRELAEANKWDKRSAARASEAISLNPNGHVDRETYGLLAWAMNVGGYAEVSLGPYRVLMHPETLKELEQKHPRDGFYEAA
ncbi:MAG TPA: hypothetical protein VMV01_00980, partial [Planctomycetota bacterium]|nr:hypothetical protein [Planctomycetota bacterium]